MMRQKFLEIMGLLWRDHRPAAIGAAVGLSFALSVLILGFWSTLFIVLCVGLGLAAGIYLESDESRLRIVSEKIEAFRQRR